MWTRAVWIEKGREEEGVVPSSWIKEDDLYWPPGVNAKKAMEEKRDPGDSWRKFKIIKIKHQSGSRTECEEYDLTTAQEESDQESQGRAKKKKVFEDYVMEDQQDVAESGETREKTTKQSKKDSVKSPPLPHPPKKVSTLELSTVNLGRLRPQASKSRSMRSPQRSRSKTRSQNSKSRSRSKTRSERSRSRSKTRSERSRLRSEVRDIHRSRSRSNTKSNSMNTIPQRSHSSSHTNSWRSPSGSQRSNTSLRRSRSRSTIRQSRSRSRSSKSRSRYQRFNSDKKNTRSRTQHFSRSRSRSRSSSSRQRSTSRGISISSVRSYSTSRSRSRSHSKKSRSKISSKSGSKKSTSQKQMSKTSDKSKRSSRRIRSRSRSNESESTRNALLLNKFLRQTASNSKSRHLGEKKKASQKETNRQQDVYPMSEAKFQKRVLYLLTDIRQEVRALKNQPGLTGEGENLELQKAMSLDDVNEIEESLKKEEIKTKYIQRLSLIGGISAKDCTRKVMERAGTIAGAVIGGIVGLGIILFVVFGIRAAMRKKTSGVRGTVVQPQQTITVVSTNQYPSMPAPPPPYVQPGNTYPPPSYPPPQPGQMGYGYPPPANDPAYPPPPK